MTHSVTETSIERFRQHLLQEEKSKATIHKNMCRSFSAEVLYRIL